jgi:hypothetical protein
MGQYDVQQVCLNGHQVTDTYRKHPQHRRDFCAECGERTILQCPACTKEIPGDYVVPGVFAGGTTPVPAHCAACGKPYPWTERQAALVESAKASRSDGQLVILDKVLERFHLVVRQLRTRHEDRHTLDVKDEYDVQDLVHALLRLFFEDIRVEEYTPSYAGKSARMDFLLKDFETAVEVKMTRPGLTGREVGTQLIDDIARYQVHPSCKRLVCFVYDPEGRVANPKGLQADLSRVEGKLEVKVVIVPRGH